MAIELGFIYGASLGFEYMPDDGTDDVIKSALVIDLFIVRLAFAFLR